MEAQEESDEEPMVLMKVVYDDSPQSEAWFLDTRQESSNHISGHIREHENKSYFHSSLVKNKHAPI
jgi:hypothetical protein